MLPMAMGSGKDMEVPVVELKLKGKVIRGVESEAEVEVPSSNREPRVLTAVLKRETSTAAVGLSSSLDKPRSQ